MSEVARERKFHLGDVLSVTMGRLISPRHIDGVYDILNFMTGDDLFTHQLPRANDECKPFLLEQFPQLATPEMDFAVAELGEMLKTKSGKTEKEKLVAGWLAKQVAKYGEMFAVKPIPSEKYAVKNPIHEVLEMIDPRTKVIAVGI